MVNKEIKDMTFVEKVSYIQCTLNAPKNMYNSFGKYKYRNLEGIFEGLKPLLALTGLAVNVSDEVVMVGDRIYVKATSTITDGTNSMDAVGYAREDNMKKGMDLSQLTGACSSYARKYSMNGLFAIDDTVDADGMDNKTTSKQPTKQPTKPPVDDDDGW